MAELRIRMSKKNDGTIVIAYTRPDGTSTWQRGKHDFFAYHDLEHYAIETTLGLKSAFLGMMGRGWDLEDFGSPWPRGKFPEDALEDLMLAECLAGAMDLNRVGSYDLPAEQVNETLREILSQYGVTLQRRITTAEMERIRAMTADLHERWQNVPVDGSLEIAFPL